MNIYINRHENAHCVLNWTMIVLLALYSVDFVKVGLLLCAHVCSTSQCLKHLPK